ncbi:MAG: FAD-dependent oxidoreductase [Bauldia sp.]|nr:FAD-dependent oxidoreductase [Bauldia sp.]
MAVIGTGIAGLAAAWLLGRRHAVTVYERDSWLGGHAHTVMAPAANGPIPVDTGFIVYNEANYPNLAALFRHLGVRTEPSNMSFSASVDGGRFEYSSASANAYCGQRLNLLRPRFWRMTRDLLRFYPAARALPTDGSCEDITIGEWLDREGYSERFVGDHVLPMAAAIWSTTPAEIRAYPLRAYVRFFASHGLLSISRRHHWRTVSGGSREYVERISAGLTDVRLETPVRRIERGPAGVLVEDETGRVERFSDVVIAAHADDALKLLGDADPVERSVLGAFAYTRNDAVLHTDASLMPRNRRVWSSWNFIGEPGASAEGQLTVTYWMNRLQNIDPATPLFLTLNPRREPKAGAVIGRYSYSHPYFDRGALAAQQQLWRLQGVRRTWFCGAHFGYGFHEDALQAGLAVGEALGGERRPWPLPEERIAPAWGPAPAEIAEVAA